MGSEAKRPPVFVSYRRGSGAATAKNIADAINGEFGLGTAFFDDVSIAPTTDWPTELEESVRSARVLIVVVTEDWLKSSDPHGRRLIDREVDWCRKEVEVALGAGVAVCPILADGFEMPPPEALPESIQKLSHCAAIEWSSEGWGEGLAKIRDVVKPLLDAPEDGVAPTTALLRRYGACLVRAHSRLVTLFPQSEKGLEDVYVEVQVGLAKRADDGGGARPAAREIVDEGPIAREVVHRKMSLRKLMDTGGGTPDARAFVVLGEPGAGKSTIARHLMLTVGRTLSGRNEPLGPGDPLPVYVSLPSLTGSTAVRDPLEVAEEAACSGEDAARLGGLKRLLAEIGERAVRGGPDPSNDSANESANGPSNDPANGSANGDGSATGGTLWLLLDGLDEVAQRHMGTVRRAIHGWVERFPNARIAVFSRVIEYEAVKLGGSFQSVRLAPLERRDKGHLLANWIGAAAPDFLAQLERSPEMSVLSGNPLLLTLLAKLWLQDRHVPEHRIAMYGAAIEMLLRTSHDEDRAPIRAPADVRIVLRELALELQGSATSAWTIEELNTALWQCRERERAVNRPIESMWEGDNEAWLRDVDRRTGIVTSDAAVGSTWTFLHRQFREFLAAEALVKSDRKWDEIADLSEEGLPRWSETIGMYCGLVKRPQEVLGRLREASPEATMKALVEVDGPPARDLFEFVWSVPSEIEGWTWSEEQPSRFRWDGDDLLRLVDAWIRRGRWTESEARDALLARVRPEVGTPELSWCYYVLHSPSVGGVSAVEFFALAGRPMPDPEEFDWVPIPAGDFTMGSPEDEAERFEAEGPQHQVRVAEFGLLRGAVTNAQYARFDKAHQAGALQPKAEGRECASGGERWLVGGVSVQCVGRRSAAVGVGVGVCVPCGHDGSVLVRRGADPRAGELQWELVVCRRQEGQEQAVHGGGRRTASERLGPPGDARERATNGVRIVGTGATKVRRRMAVPGRRAAPAAASCAAAPGSSYGRFCRSAYRNWFAPGLRHWYLGFRPARSH